MDGKNKAETKPTKSKPKATKSKNREKKYQRNIMKKNLYCNFIGKTLIRMYSESNRPMSSNITHTLHACTACMLKSVDSCLLEKSLVPDSKKSFKGNEHKIRGYSPAPFLL